MTPAEALAALGDTPDAVAETLRAGGWRGRWGGWPCLCPIARYLKAATEVDWSVSRTRARRLWDNRRIDLPDPVSKFVARYDAGHYPDLVAW